MPQVSFKLIRDKEGQVSKWYPFWIGTMVGLLFVFFAFVVAIVDISKARRMHTVTFDELNNSNAASVLIRAEKPQTARIHITVPEENTTLSGTPQIEMDPVENGVPIFSVRLLVDGTEVAVFGTAPYRYTWDSRKVANGKHVIAALAVDGEGFVSVTHRNVYVQN
ncbi:MAG: Ig-like domain-containing protein [bacterium]|nr:Ig-like domain-containing protein [bacterium]